MTTIVIALGDRSSNTCHDLRLGESIRCEQPPKNALKNGIWHLEHESALSRNIHQGKTQTQFSHHNISKRSH